MIYTSELFKRLEGDATLKKAHAAEGSLGGNRLVILPVVVGFIAAFVAYFFMTWEKPILYIEPMLLFVVC